MESIVLCIVIGTITTISYTLGLKNGQRLKNEETIELPQITKPITEVTDKFISPKKEKFNEEEQFDWDNINNFNGTIESQKLI